MEGSVPTANRNDTRYHEEFKQQIVDLYNTGVSVRKLVNEYGLVEQTICKWIRFYSLIIKAHGAPAVCMKEYKNLKRKLLSPKWRMIY